MGSVSSFIPTVSGIKPVCQGAPIPLNFLQHKISPLWLLSRCVWRAHSLNTLGESGCCFPWKMASLHKNRKTWNRCRQLSQWFLESISMSRLSLFHLVLIIAQCFVFDPRLLALGKLALIVYHLLSIACHLVMVHIRSFSKSVTERPRTWKTI